MNIAELAVRFTWSDGSIGRQVAAYNVPVIVNGLPKTILAAPSPFWTGDFTISRSIFGVSVMAMDENR
jgi:hypothetical protein